MAKESVFKSEVIEALFRKRWKQSALELADPLVTLNEVSDAIAAYQQQTSNFHLRGSDTSDYPGASEMVLAAGFLAVAQEPVQRG